MRHTWPSRTAFLESSLDGIGANDRVGNRVTCFKPFSLHLLYLQLSSIGKPSSPLFPIHIFQGEKTVKVSLVASFAPSLNYFPFRIKVSFRSSSILYSSSRS